MLLQFIGILYSQVEQYEPYTAKYGYFTTPKRTIFYSYYLVQKYGVVCIENTDSLIHQSGLVSYVEMLERNYGCSKEKRSWDSSIPSLFFPVTGSIKEPWVSTLSSPSWSSSRVQTVFNFTLKVSQKKSTLWQPLDRVQQWIRKQGRFQALYSLFPTLLITLLMSIDYSRDSSILTVIFILHSL